MDSRANMSSSGKRFTERSRFYAQGCSLKKRALLRWIYGAGYTQPYVAQRMGLDVDEFKDRLRTRKKFDMQEIRALVFLMGARAAFGVIYFPTNDERERIGKAAFGEESK